MNQASGIRRGWDEVRQLRMMSLIFAKGLKRYDLQSEQIAVPELNSRFGDAGFQVVRCRAGLPVLRRDPKPSAQVTACRAFQTVRNVIELGDVFLVNGGVKRQLSFHYVELVKYLGDLFLALRKWQRMQRLGVVCRRDQ